MSNTFQVTYSREAVNDLGNIYAYIAFELQVPETAKKQLNRIRNKILSLDFMPEKHVLVDWEPWKSRKTHKMPVDNYVVFYMVNTVEKKVTVLRILYSGADINNILESG